MLLALGFFVAEAFVPSHGALALAGAVSFVLGALLLFDPAGDIYDVSIWVALVIALTLALVIGGAMAKVWQVRRTRPQTGEEELVGSVGIVRRRLDPDGHVFVHGELWQAWTDDGPLDPGDEVRVDRIDGLRLGVSRAERVEADEPVAAGTTAETA